MGRCKDFNISIWDSHMTIHSSISEKTNAVLLSITRDKKCKKSRVMQELIETHPEFKDKLKKMEEDGFFI